MPGTTINMLRFSFINLKSGDVILNPEKTKLLIVVNDWRLNHDNRFFLHVVRPDGQINKIYYDENSFTSLVRWEKIT